MSDDNWNFQDAYDEKYETDSALDQLEDIEEPQEEAKPTEKSRSKTGGDTE